MTNNLPASAKQESSRLHIFLRIVNSLLKICVSIGLVNHAYKEPGMM